MSSWPVWVAIILLLDVGIGFLSANRLATIIPLKRLAWVGMVEVIVAIGLLIWHFTR